MLAPALSAIAEADIQGEPVESVPVAETEDVNLEITRLKELLVAADTRSRQVAEKLLATVGETERDNVQLLISHIDIYDFDAALSVLAEVNPR